MDRRGRATSCLMALWPGLPPLWVRGCWRGMCQAVGFSILLQLTILTTVIWPESLTLVSRVVVWFCAVGFWSVFAAPEFGQAMAGWSRGFRAAAAQEPLFHEAQREYLRGNWHRAEKLVRRLLDSDRADLEARLLLATLYRRVGRLEAAGQELDRVTGLPGARRWAWELSGERRRLHEAKRRRGVADAGATAGRCETRGTPRGTSEPTQDAA